MRIFLIFAHKIRYLQDNMQAFEPVKYIPKAVEPILMERFSEMAKSLTILTDEEWDAIRATKPKNTIYFQPGGQDDMLSSTADISIVGGSRGGGKSYILLMQALYDLTNPNFRAIIFRKDLDDLSDIIDTSYELFETYGLFNKSKNDLTWNFNSGGWLTFSYHNMEQLNFHDRYQGKQYPYIGIDEVTQMSYPKFKVLTMSNRNAYGIRNRIVGSCNPDPDSWVAKFIEWWIDPETGLPIPERSGKVRYCTMMGEDVTEVVWGDTREEVFEKCKAEIMAAWRPEYDEFGTPQDLFIKSVSFVPAKLTDNKQLLNSDPSYLANLFNQDEETRARFLDGNWKYKASGSDLIKMEHMERFYDNAEQTGDGIRRVTCDAAFDGGDMCVFYLWIGNHMADIATCMKDAKQTVSFAKALLERWRVREENFAYDLPGVGQVFKGFFPKALPFDPRQGVDDKFKGVYFNIKAQAFQYFADHIKDGTYSISSELLDRRFSGKGYKNKLFREILNEERKCVRFREDDPTRVVDKVRVMKRIIHRSPDFIEGAAIREIWNIKHQHRKPKNFGLLGATPRYMTERERRRRNPFAQNINNMYNGRRW